MAAAPLDSSGNPAFHFREMRSNRAAARPRRRPNLLAIAVTGFVHLTVAAALLFQWQLNKLQAPEPIIFLQITEQKAEKPIETPPAPKLKIPTVDVPPIKLPDIPHQPNAITLPPKPVPAPTPPAAPDVKVIETYQVKLMRHLNAYKRYPSASRAQREEGVALLSFRIDRSGSVLAYRLVRSSGYPRLDEEVLALIQRASPVPQPPAELWQNPMELVVPVDFSIR